MLNHTRGSVLLAYLFQGAAKTWTQTFSIDHTDPLVGWTLDGPPVLVVVIVEAYAGAENLLCTNRRIQE